MVFLVFFRQFYRQNQQSDDDVFCVVLLEESPLVEYLQCCMSVPRNACHEIQSKLWLREQKFTIFWRISNQIRQIRQFANPKYATTQTTSSELLQTYNLQYTLSGQIQILSCLLFQATGQVSIPLVGRVFTITQETSLQNKDRCR